MRGNERSFNTIVVASSKQDVHSYAMEHRCRAALACALVTAWPAATLAQGTHDGATFPVGIRELEYIDPHEGGRHLTLNVFYPAAIRERPAPAFVMPFFTKLNLYKDADRHSAARSIRSSCSPTGAAATASITLGSPSFWRRAATSWPRSTTIAPTPTTRRLPTSRTSSGKRPRDVGLSISFLLNDPFWGTSIDADRIGVAGHSQGGFTALWVGGASINPEKYLAFQRGWRNNQMVPQYLRNELPLDAAPALDVHDKRVKAVFAMAPEIVQAFGMDEAGLRQLAVPTYITVGAGDTQAPPKENAEFAARHIPY